MNVELATQPNCQAILKIELPAERVASARDRVIEDFRQHARLPGFRPGKAPKQVVASKFKKDIEEELTRKLLSEATRESIREKSLNVLSIADVGDIELPADGTMRFRVTVLTAPDFELPDYKSIPVAQPSTEVADEDIDSTLERLREQGADFIEAEARPLAMGDFAVIDYKGTIDGKPVDETVQKGAALAGKEDFWMLMSENAFLPGFCPNLVGMTTGTSKEFDVTLPADFPIEDLRGSTIHFAVTLKSIRERVLPEVDDAFAATMLPGKTLAELRDQIRAELRVSKERDAIREKRDAMVNELLSRVDFELPEAMVHQETRRILQDIVRDNQLRGVSEKELKENKEELVKGASLGARNRVKATFVLVRIAEKEGIKVSDIELNTRISGMARQYDMPAVKLKKELEKRDAIDSVREEMLVAKVLDFLISGDSVQSAPEPPAATPA